VDDPHMTFARTIVAAVAVFMLTACGPDAAPVTQTRVVTPSTSPSPSDSPSPSPEPPAVTAAVATDVPAVPTTGPAPKKTTAAAPKTTKPAPPKTTQPPANPGPIVHPGAFCSPEGAIGYTSAGTRMRCTLKAGESQPRWRAA
jgi:hypothetical protein